VISRTIVMTGASDGIGAAGAARLNALGNTVVVIGRSKEKTMAVANSLEAEYFVADFSDLDQVRALAANLLERYETIDALVNNAGGIMGPRRITVDGHEATFQINHLAPFLLTTLLLDRLITSRASVITTSSVANRFVGRVNIDDLDSEQRYSSFPGAVASNFSNESGSPFHFAYNSVLRRVLLSPTQGADTLEWLATAKPGTSWTSGEYYAKRKVARANKQTSDPKLAEQLWDRSAAMIAER
jgi:NAD(P)-dependent dehydrogenase (short-subunit alcohol dehydrogenase family)